MATRNGRDRRTSIVRTLAAMGTAVAAAMLVTAPAASASTTEPDPPDCVIWCCFTQACGPTP